MSSWVGVLHWSSCLDLPKKELLLFDKVAVTSLESALDFHRRHMYGEPDVADQLELLEREGLIIRTEGPPQDFYHRTGREGDLRLIAALYQWAETLRAESHGPWKECEDGSKYRFGLGTTEAHRKLELSFKADRARCSLVARTTADYLRSVEPIDAVAAEPMPEFLDFLHARLDEKPTDSGISDVAHIVLKALPQPGELVPLEDLIAFKADADYKHSLLELRIWMREAARLELPARELEEKLEWLLHEYENDLIRHRIQFKRGVLETVITTTLETAENLVKLRWSDAAQALFALRRGRLALLESEANAKGREVAYVSKATSRFASESP